MTKQSKEEKGTPSSSRMLATKDWLKEIGSKHVEAPKTVRVTIFENPRVQKKKTTDPENL